MLATLTLNCNNQSLEWEQDPTEIYAGNINIDSISFKFCELWDGYSKTAVFYRNGQEAYHVLLNDDNTCLIPPEITETNGLVHIGVFGIKDDCRRTTAVKNWYLNEGILTEGKPSDPTPDIYQQIINLCNETKAIAQSVREDADNGVFKGDKGDKGEKGDTGVQGIQGIQGEKGEDGYTPRKGVDYYTETDKQELVNDVLAALPNGDEVSY